MSDLFHSLRGIHRVIVGGESGPGALFFFRQWGGGSKGRAGRMLQGRMWDDMPTRRPVA